MRDDGECALFHALYPITGGAVTDAPRVTRTAEPAPIEVLGSHCAIGPMRSPCAIGPIARPVRAIGRGGKTLFGMFLFGHWIAHARVRGPYIDITFDPHSHEVAELLGTKLAPTRLASLLALVLARCPYVARATRAREGILPRKAREADRREEAEARKADRSEAESDSDDTELVMLTDITGPSDLTGPVHSPSDLARAQVVVFSSHGPRGPHGPHGPNGLTGAMGANGASAKWARVVSWDTESLARLAFHVDVRIIIQ